MPAWEQLGMQAAGTAVNAGMGLLLQGMNDRRQLKQQGKLQQLQIKGNKELTDYNFMKQMEMWKNTNYPAQMAMLKAAGLNPALIYENGGAGAETTIQTGNVAGANAPTGGGEIMQLMGMGLQRDLQQAQIENIKAQTDKTRAEIPNLPKTGQQIEATTQNLKADTQNKETQNELMQIEKSIQSIKEHIAGKTQNTAIAIAQKELQIQQERLTQMKRDNKMGQQTYDDNVKIIHQKAIAEVLENSIREFNISIQPEVLHQLKTITNNIFTDTWLKQKEPEFRVTEQEIKDRLNDLHDPNLTPQIKEIIGGVIGGILGGGIIRSTPNRVGFKVGGN